MCYSSSTDLPSPYLPFAVYLYSLALFSSVQLIFRHLTPLYHRGGYQLEQFPGNDGCFAGLLYGILFYSIPTVEYYTELVYLPEIKEWSVWTLGAVQPFWQDLVKVAVGCIVYPVVCALYGTFYILRSFRLISGWRINVTQSSMELLMHVLAQVREKVVLLTLTNFELFIDSFYFAILFLWFLWSSSGPSGRSFLRCQTLMTRRTNLITTTSTSIT